MIEAYQKVIDVAKSKKNEIRAALATWKRTKPKWLDRKFHEAHTRTFSEIDCLQCANCCKTTGPLFTDQDIRRISRHLKMTEAHFEASYLRIDEDEDYVLQQVPCCFLEEDNRCGIYEVRPQACAEFPHTDRKKVYQAMDVTAENVFICPATAKIVERVLQAVD